MPLIIICIIGLSIFGIVMLPLLWGIVASYEVKKKQARKEADNILNNDIVASVANINQTIDKLQQITTFNVHEPMTEEDKMRINKLREIRDHIEVTST